jgi:hypothetical protein
MEPSLVVVEDEPDFADYLRRGVLGTPVIRPLFRPTMAPLALVLATPFIRLVFSPKTGLCRHQASSLRACVFVIGRRSIGQA